MQIEKKKKPWEAPLLVKQKKWLFSASMKEELTLFFLVFFFGGGGGWVGEGKLKKMALLFSQKYGDPKLVSYLYSAVWHNF